MPGVTCLQQSRYACTKQPDASTSQPQRRVEVQQNLAKERAAVAALTKELAAMKVAGRQQQKLAARRAADEGDTLPTPAALLTLYKAL